MKLTFILLTVTLLQVSAAVRAQKVTLNEKNTSLPEVFKSIRQQTGFNFIYDMKLIETARPVTIKVTNADVKDVLHQCFMDQPFTYELENKTIILKEKEVPALIRSPLLKDSTINIGGKVLDEKGQGLVGATVKVSGTTYVIGVGSGGAFSIQLPTAHALLIVSYIGYKTKEVTISGADVDLTIHMEVDVAKLGAVSIVSTGYQTLPKERATGSFEVVSNALFNRTTGPDVLARLEGIVPGLLYDKSLSTTPDVKFMTIRGQSTLVANKQPLIILDNFPYDGDVKNINPNDVESITILKDAAAASIWGIRAGNGVVVITTKKGGYDRPMQVSVNANVMISQKPNLYYLPEMSSSDYIDAEKFAFAQGNYDYLIGNTYTYPLLTPVVDLLAQARAGTITQASADAQINALRSNDVRKDYLKYVYRQALNQQYSINLNGGSQTVGYAISAGYDKGLGSNVTFSNDRLTMRSDLTFKPFKNLELQIGSLYTQANQYTPSTSSGGVSYGSNGIPYLRLADDNGNPLVVGKDYLASFAANPGDSRLLNWQYKPLVDMYAGKNTTKSYDILINLGARYQINKVFSAEFKYDYDKSVSNNQILDGADSYFTRNYINLFTQPVGSAVERPVPLGGIVNQNDADFYSRTVRLQLNANKKWGDKSEFNAIVAAETNEKQGSSHQFMTYGYDPTNLTYQSVDFITQFPQFIQNGSASIGNSLSYESTLYRSTSLLANAAYSYDHRYTISASARKDASNLFGVTANHRGVPLWSAGLSWDITQEKFYKWDFLPMLKLRATYGYNGNAASNLAAYSTITYRNSSPYTLSQYAQINNPANDNLRWEKVRVVNLGLDFGFRNNRFSGSIEYFTKDATDVIYTELVPFTTGFQYATTNSVSLNGRGIDLSLHSLNVKGAVKWNTDAIFSYATNKVAKYTPIASASPSDYLTASNAPLPILGAPLYAVYGYKWAGLDPTNGDPQGYLDGKVSKDYASLDYVPVADLQYFGSAIPVYYGSIRNSVSYKNITVSANIIYKFDYFFRRSSINYGSFFYGGQGNADYAKRWQKPGDEAHTSVPSMIYPDDYYRDGFYAGSSALISKGDHIRLQDITASYTIDKAGRYFKSLRLYANLSNIGILWRANKYGIDPDYGSSGIPAPKTFSLGLNVNF